MDDEKEEKPADVNDEPVYLGLIWPRVWPPGQEQVIFAYHQCGFAYHQCGAKIRSVTLRLQANFLIWSGCCETCGREYYAEQTDWPWYSPW